MQDYKKLKVWQKGMDVVDTCYEIGHLLPSYEQFGLRSQLQRSSVSIPSNVAEGRSRRSARDFGRFVEIALGSAFESETVLLIIQRQHRKAKELANRALDQIDEIKKMLHALYERLTA